MCRHQSAKCQCLSVSGLEHQRIFRHGKDHLGIHIARKPPRRPPRTPELVNFCRTGVVLLHLFRAVEHPLWEYGLTAPPTNANRNIQTMITSPTIASLLRKNRFATIIPGKVRGHAARHQASYYSSRSPCSLLLSSSRGHAGPQLHIKYRQSGCQVRSVPRKTACRT